MNSESSWEQNSSNLINSFVMSSIENKDSEASTESMLCEACDQKVEDERFEAFDNEKIISIFHRAFAVRQRFRIHKHKLSSSFKTVQNLKNHWYRKEFMKTQQDHLESHHQMQSFHKTDWKHAKEQQILHCMWVFIYKTDKHDFLQKCKTRLMMCENQQIQKDLLTCMTILTSMTFQMLMTITAKFDLKTI